jgi:V8-like Glu-specific endopeptidase
MADVKLEQQERNRLIGILADLYGYFTDVRGRRVFIKETADLGRFLPSMNLEGAPKVVAGDLVGRLEKFGQLPEKPTYHSLGALLNAMLTLGELSFEDETFLASLIVRYSLIADSVYLTSLRDRYNIAETEVRRQPPEEVIPPRIRIEEFKDPEFNVQLGDEQVLENIINSEDNFLDLHLLQGALYCAQAIGMIELPQGTALGTGFLVGPDLLLTNQHVLNNKDELEEVVVRFGYVSDPSGVISSGKVVRLQPDFYFSSPAHELDYALVRLKEKPLENIAVTNNELRTKSMVELARMGQHRGYIELAETNPVLKSRVNIIQHPDGKPLKVVMTQNYIVHKTDLRVQYIADTTRGSSGSPVFNQRWEIVALHHSGNPYPPESFVDTAKKVWKGQFRVNEGIPIRAILKDFKKQGIERYLPLG